VTTLHGASLVNGAPLPDDGNRWSALAPRTGQSLEPTFGEATPEHVAAAAAAAAGAAPILAATSPAQRTVFLRAIAAELERRRHALVARADEETALGSQRLDGEVTRSIVQFEAFADLVAAGAHLGARVDHADDQAHPAPRPDLRKLLVPLGPVAVFGASNFPFAFSTAGGDTASAFAAGCPVVVKGHPSHPGTSELVAQAINAAAAGCELPPGVFALLQGRSPELSRWLVEHPAITAVGFTGSQHVGRILCELAAARPTPIPVYAEMGSLNPVFVFEEAIEARGEGLARELAGSALLGAGQFCTKPGLLVVPAGHVGDEFVARLGTAYADAGARPLLNASIAERLRDDVRMLRRADKARVVAEGRQALGPLEVAPALVEVDWDDIDRDAVLLEEHFGPVSVVIRIAEKRFPEVVARLDGQLTATIHAESPAGDGVGELVEQAVRKVGRLIWNGFPTGVAVTAAMHHGGPWPATSSSAHTSVGLDAIWRFLRPVAFQGFPEELLPAAVQSANPWGVPQRHTPAGTT